MTETPPSKVRRSGRIALEIPILLSGVDVMKNAFSEHTKTVMLSRHGAGVVSQYRFAPETRLTVRLEDTLEEAEVQVVGLLGSEAGKYTYGMAFVAPDINFWGIEFVTEPTSVLVGHHKLFACGKCKVRERIDLNELQLDTYAVHKVLARSCKHCGTQTLWKRADDPSGKSASIAPETP
jgi:hypothetical protein